MTTLQALALLGAALFTGGALYVSLVEHPARMALPPAAAVQQFRVSYRRAAPWQAASAIVAGACGVLAWLAGGGWTWAVGGLIVAAVVPYTLLVVMPTTTRLIHDGVLDDAERGSLLTHWARLHWVRSAWGAIGLLVLVRAALARV